MSLGVVSLAEGHHLCTLPDIARGTAARRSVLTLDMQARFLSPGRGVLLAEGCVVLAGRSILFCEATITADTGDVIAAATGILKSVAQS